MKERQALKSFPVKEANILRTFGIDVGNYATKSRHSTLISGYTQNKYNNELAAKALIMGKGNEKIYYTSSEKPFQYSVDKTKDDFMFNLTMMSVAQEALRRGVLLTGGEEINLAIGMPPGDFIGSRVQQYKDYYMKRGNDIEFEYEGVNFKFSISNVEVNAQCWAASIQYYELNSNESDVLLFDFGGMTIDVITLHNNEIVQESIRSYESGVNKMLSKIATEMRGETTIRFSPQQIMQIIKNPDAPSTINKDHVNRVLEKANLWVKDVIGECITDGVEFRLYSVTTIGGGTLLLGTQLSNVAEQFGFKQNMKHIKDERANAMGYEALYALKYYGINPIELNAFWTEHDKAFGIPQKDESDKLA